MAVARRRHHEPRGLIFQRDTLDQYRRRLALVRVHLNGMRSARQQEEERYPKTLREYAERYRRIDDRPFTLANHLPLEELYDAAMTERSIAVMKPSQRGVSEWAITFALFVLDVGARAFGLPKSGLNVGYIFPHDKALGDFSKERVAGLKLEHEHLRRLFSSGSFDGIGFRQIGASYLYLRGGASTSGLLSFSADMIVRDEYDVISREAREMAEKRMNASLFRRLVDISTPTLPGLGIHDRYIQSDQRVYVQPCPNCREENQYDFFRDTTVGGVRYDVWQHYTPQRIRREDVALTCPRCEYALDKAGRCAPGRYVPQQPEITSLRGYHVPALAYPIPNLMMELAVKSVDPDPSAVEQFMRQDLGIPYHSKGTGISEEDLVPLSLDLQNGALPPGPYHRVTMGVDVGARFHCRVVGWKEGEQKPYVLRMATVESWQAVDDLMDVYRVSMAVVDSMPDQHGAAAFVARYKGRACVADYPTQMAALKGVLFAPADPRKAVQDGFVRINRTMGLDAVMTNVLTQREHWPSSVVNDPEVRSNMTGAARVTSLDARGQVVASWTRLRADHYLHACFEAGTLVKTDRGDVRIEEVREGDLVWTRAGLRRVNAAGQTDPNAAVRRYTFTDGSSVVATANHPIHTQRGFVPLYALTYDDIVSTWQTSRPSPTEASLFAGIRTAREGLTGSTSRRTGRYASGGSAGFTRRFIGITTARSQTATSSITKTRTRSTTPPVISGRSPGVTISADILAWEHRESFLTRFDHSLTHGGKPKRGDHGIESTARRRSLNTRLSSRRRASSAENGGRSERSVAHGETRTVLRSATQRLAAPAVSTVSTPYVRSVHLRSVRDGILRLRRVVERARARGSVRLSGVGPERTTAVYNLSVDRQEEYFANGLLVHNCVYEFVARSLTPKLRRPARVVQGTAKTQMPSGTNYRPAQVRR